MSTASFRPDDFETSLWKRLAAKLEADLAAARGELESPVLDEKPNASVRLRARIAILTKYLALPNEVAQAAKAKATPTHDGFPHDSD